MDKSNSRQCLTQYASNSTIHGVRYIAGDSSNKAFRVFWAIAFILSIIGLGYYACGVYTKWSIEPDIGIKMRLKSMREIPFPAITICSPLFAKNHLANFSKFYSELSSKSGKIYPHLSVDELNYLAAGVQACSPTSSSLVLKGYKNQTTKNYSKLLTDISLDVSQQFPACRFKKNYLKCEKMINRVLTNNGYCYSINMQGYYTIFNSNTISRDFDSYKRVKISKFYSESNETINDDAEIVQWTLDGGYTSDDDEIFPIRAIKLNQLSVYMNLSEIDATNLCLSQGKGYKVIFHLPNEVPTPFHDEYFIPFNFERMMTLTAKSYRTDEELRTYAPEARRCYFGGERKLKFFKSYTKAHCDYECLTNYTLRECGCVKFSMPRTDDTPVCDLDKAKCYFRAMMEWPDKDKCSENSIMPCNCMPTCSDVKYSIKLDKEAELDSSIRLAHLKNRNVGNVYSKMAIRFNDHAIDEQENYVAYKLQNFIADCGGLLGLFMGCSILSIVELIFHCIKACFKKDQSQEMNVEHISDEVSVKNLSQHENYSPKSKEIFHTLKITDDVKVNSINDVQ